MTISPFDIRADPNIGVRKLMVTHEHDRLRQLLLLRLGECGWRDQVKQECKRMFEENNALLIDDVIAQVTPLARELVPVTVKKELLQRIKTSLTE